MSLRILFVYIFLPFVADNLSAQPVTETVLFDNYINSSDNDLVNHFYGFQSLVMSPANGITGGCLLTPDSNIWGNDNSRYCSKYSISNSDIYKTTLSFYYDQSLVSPTGFDRAASIWFQPYTDPNHYIIASVSHQSKIIVYTYYSVHETTLPMTLQTGNWYNLEVEFYIPAVSNPHALIVKCRVNDLGPTGLSAPFGVDSVTGSFADTVFTTDDAVEISITGARYGGVSSIDNFTFYGVKSADSCLFTGINHDERLNENIKISYTNGYLYLEGINLSNRRVEIFDITGKKVISSLLNSDVNILDINNLKKGIYLLSLYRAGNKSDFKFIVAE